MTTDTPGWGSVSPMPRRPYVASGKAEPGAMPALFAATLGAAIGVGLLEGFVSRWLSLLLLFPAGIGLAAGAGAIWAINAKKIRAPLAAFAVAALAGLLGEMTVHVVRYQVARAEIADFLENDPEAKGFVAQNGPSVTVDLALAGEDGKLPFVGYLEMAARNGITITKASSSSSTSKPTLTGTGVYSLWAGNFLIAILVAAFMARGEAKKPFCESCIDWYNQVDRLAVGDGARQALKETRARIEAGQLADALRELGQSNGKTASVLLLKGCSRCNSHEPLLELKSLAGLKTNKPQEAIFYSTLITSADAHSLRTAVAQPSSESAPA